MSEPVALVVGAGNALGGAVARRFAKAGLTVCVSRRNADKLEPLLERIRADGGTVHGFGSDARRVERMTALVEGIERDIGPIEVAVHNIGANVKFDILETTERVFLKVWELACLSAFHMGKTVAAHMVPRGRGTMIFTGATASVRGGAGRAFRRSPPACTASGRSPRASRASCSPRGFTSPMPSSTA